MAASASGVMPIEDEAADDSASDAENELDDDEPTPTSRRHHAEDEKLIPAFEFLAAVGGKALTVRSVTSFEIDDPCTTMTSGRSSGWWSSAAAGSTSSLRTPRG